MRSRSWMQKLSWLAGPFLVTVALMLFSPSTGAAEGRVVAPEGTDLGLPFSAGILSRDFLFLSGAIGNTPGTTRIEGDAAQQTRRTIDNQMAVLDAAGLDLSRIVEVTAYVSDIRYGEPLAAVLAESYPALAAPRATVEADIALPNAYLELSAIAARPGLEIRHIVPEGWAQPADGTRWATLAGHTLFVSGQTSRNPADGKVVDGDVAAQTRRALENLGQVLRAAELDLLQVVSCRVYLPDPRDFQAMNEVYRTFFPKAPPARATVRARLLDPRLKVEIQCLASRSADRQAVYPEGASPGALPFSPAIQVGDRLFLSGMVGRAEDGFPSDVAAQTRITLERLAATLKAAGMSFDDVESATVYLTDIRHYGAMNQVYRELMPSPPPARATVGAPLMLPEALVEIAMIASPAASADEHGKNAGEP